MSSHGPHNGHRRRSSTSGSPVMSTWAAGADNRRDDTRRPTDWRDQPASPPILPTPSRMSLSALVNSPPTERRTHAPLAASYDYRSPSYSPPPDARHRRTYSTSRSPYLPPPNHRTLPPPSMDFPPPLSSTPIYYNRGAPPPIYSNNSHSSRDRDDYQPPQDRQPRERSYGHYSNLLQARSVSPRIGQQGPSSRVSQPVKSPSRAGRKPRWDYIPIPPLKTETLVRLENIGPTVPVVSYRLGDRLLGNEDVWEDGLKAYQRRREAEVDMIGKFEPNPVIGKAKKAPKKVSAPGPKRPRSYKAQPSLYAGVGTQVPPPSTEPIVSEVEPEPTPITEEDEPLPLPLPLPQIPIEPTSTPAESPALPDAPPPPKPKRTGWPSDHPSRIAKREAKEAAILAGGGVIPPPAKKQGPKPKKTKISNALDDELLGLAEGGDMRSSPALGNGSEMDIPETDPEPVGPETIVLPCGLTRAEVIRKVEGGDLEGLTENDVKQVQDEMWIRAKEPAGGVSIRKDGNYRRKPGPAKGWKAMRGDDGSSKGKRNGGSSVVDDEGSSMIGADEDIAALLDDEPQPQGSSVAGDIVVPVKKEKGKGKEKAPKKSVKRKRTKSGLGEGEEEGDRTPTTQVKNLEEGEDATSSINMDLDEFPPLHPTDSFLTSMTPLEEARSPTPPPILPPAKKAKSKASTSASVKPPTIGNWNRLSKSEKELQKKAEMLAGGMAVEELATLQEADLELRAPAAGFMAGAAEVGDGEGQEQAGPVGGVRPNTSDPRGVSESEARVRYGLVEELQRQAWSAVVKDVPKVYRLFQACDQFTKLDKSRVASACLRNSVTQRPLKATYKSAIRINADAVKKSKKVIKEMLTYWRKNEKEELTLRKKSEKEALERAKAEEESREAKRQSRKLNFLLTQTELYSHFIGKKIKTAEAERPDDEDIGEGSGEGMDKDGIEKEANGDLGLDDQGEALPDIDYDDDDEENLRKHAARGAQAAIVAAKDKARAFDQAMPGGKKKEEEDMAIDIDGDELNFQNPSLGEDALTITQPKMLMAQLKEYQLKGLTWLGNLYEQGINGILADEMGLGKTIQSISLLAYLAEHHNLWGPFLVVAPSSTLHNWQQELARFVPRLKALPYWGTIKDRETLRRIWSKKNMTFDEESPFHILITSYSLAVLDEKYLSGVKWQYMILDEAQAIKSSSSSRWKSLLSLPCRNRLLLTGTPIQNSMHELWALLHFIMPSLFDSHEEFSEWFSKDVENAAAGGSGSLQPEQLRRLHMILKPFMLRRVKKHVQKELGDKIEIDVLVDLSQRQRAIYKALRQRVSVSDLIAPSSSSIDTSNSTKNLMNLVMQFRKVCNHPDLFERADVVSPFMFGTFPQSNLSREQDGMYLPDSAKNAIKVDLPRLVWDESIGRVSEAGKAGGEGWVLRNLCTIWRPDWIRKRLDEGEDGWGFLRINDTDEGDVCKSAKGHPLVQLLEDAGEGERKVERGMYECDSDFAASKRRRLLPLAPRVPSRSDLSTPLRDISSIAWNTSILSRPDSRFTLEKAIAPPLRPSISSRSYVNAQNQLSSDPLIRSALYGAAPSEVDDPQSIESLQSLLTPNIPPRGLFASSPANQGTPPSMTIPPIKRLIVDSAKLARLDSLLRELKAGGHRVLLYFQMTKMMDLIEEYLIYRQYKYLRLDGSSAIGDRRDMVTNWQTNTDYFVFCLSTRAGGLGINLTAADTVIFYDHDWNPSNDAQAMDRAHRVGQTKQVTVYRLIARGTIEERILKLARAKKDVQDIVVGTKSLTDVAKSSEIVSLFLDDEELAESVAKRKQAEAHGYVAPLAIGSRGQKSAFGDGLGADDEDDFFSGKQVNNEDEDFGDELALPAEDVEGGVKKKKKSTAAAATAAAGGSKRKATADPGEKKAAPKKKKVKIAVGPDGLPI